MTVNAGFEQLFDLMNGKLTIEDNLASKVKTFQVQVDSSGNPLNTPTIKKGSTDRISGLIVIKATNLTSSATYPTTAPFISYTELTDSIQINNIKGLAASNLWELNVELLR